MSPETPVSSLRHPIPAPPQRQPDNAQHGRCEEMDGAELHYADTTNAKSSSGTRARQYEADGWLSSSLTLDRGGLENLGATSIARPRRMQSPLLSADDAQS